MAVCPARRALPERLHRVARVPGLGATGALRADWPALRAARGSVVVCDADGPMVTFHGKGQRSADDPSCRRKHVTCTKARKRAVA